MIEHITELAFVNGVMETFFKIIETLQVDYFKRIEDKQGKIYPLYEKYDGFGFSLSFKKGYFEIVVNLTDYLDISYVYFWRSNKN